MKNLSRRFQSSSKLNLLSLLSLRIIESNTQKLKSVIEIQINLNDPEGFVAQYTKFEEIVEQLKLCNISNGTWVDAGCGYGTYSFPLSTLTSEVIAIDVEPHNISYLKSRLPSDTNIKALIKDFNQDSYASEPVDGILFGFSLHYHPNPSLALENAFKHLKSLGHLIIFEYQRKKPVPWVPYPLPLNKLLSLLDSIGFFNINIVFTTNRFYIVQGKKP